MAERRSLLSFGDYFDFRGSDSILTDAKIDQLCKNSPELFCSKLLKQHFRTEI